VLALSLALAALALTGAALAATRAVSDPRDTVGKLDIRSARLDAVGSRLVATITTHAAWSPADLGTGGQREVCARIWTKSKPPRIHDYSICAERPSAREGLVGTVYRHGNIESPTIRVGRATVARPNNRSVTLTFASKLIGNPTVVRWQASSFYKTFDLAPNGAPARQTLR
jgi:hypothetical protein